MAALFNNVGDTAARTLHGESFGEVGLSAAAVFGALSGALAGVGFGSALPELFGTLGTMLGSGMAAGGWCALERWRAMFRQPMPRRAHERAAEPAGVHPAPTAS